MDTMQKLTGVITVLYRDQITPVAVTADKMELN